MPFSSSFWKHSWRPAATSIGVSDAAWMGGSLALGVTGVQASVDDFAIDGVHWGTVGTNIAWPLVLALVVAAVYYKQEMAKPGASHQKTLKDTKWLALKVAAAVGGWEIGAYVASELGQVINNAVWQNLAVAGCAGVGAAIGLAVILACSPEDPEDKAYVRLMAAALVAGAAWQGLYVAGETICAEHVLKVAAPYIGVGAMAIATLLAMTAIWFVAGPENDTTATRELGCLTQYGPIN